MEETDDLDTIKTAYEGVCQQLNMDTESSDAAWSSYSKIRDYYTLEGDHIEWLGCALYVAGQNSSLETVEGQAMSGNNISLTQILRETKLNLIEFFKKMKKWIEMAKLPQKFQAKVEALERKFEVASIIYDKYRKVFQDLFLLTEEQPVSTNTRQRNRKSRGNRACSAYEVFRFGWTLFIHIKSQYPQINDDLVNSHHLLLCCVDMLYCTSLMTKRRDLLNPDCPFLPASFDLEYTPPLEMPCILKELCTKYNGIEKECRVIRDYYWKPPIERLFETKVLLSSAPTVAHPDKPFLNMLTPGTFQTNDKSLNREYEMIVLAQGDFDERVFLHPSASQEIGTPVGGVNFRNSLAVHTPPRHVQFGTPLLGREMLGSRDQQLTPASEATHSVTQLHILLENCPPEPSECLVKMCGSCMANPLPDIKARVKRLSDTFVTKSPEESELPANSFVKVRLQLSVSLYYKLLDSIMRDEERKNPDYGSLQSILEYNLFHTSLFALAVEIVLCSYNSQSRVFPWVLEVFDISAYHFYKLVEPSIRQERDFPRAIVKHLNRVEEMILSSLAWRSNSPLFDAIDASGPVPSYSDVALPTTSVGGAKSSALLYPRVRSLSGVKSESPLSSLQERLCSPGSTARRQLFSHSANSGGTTSPRPTSTTPTKTTSGSTTPPRPLVPIAPKPTQGGVTITPLNQINTLLSKEISRRIQKVLSPQKESGLPNPQGTKTVAVQSNAANSTTSGPEENTSSSAQPTPKKGIQAISISVLPSPPKPVSINMAAELRSGTNVSPSKISIGSLLSPGSHQRPEIPTSPPIPSVTVTPSPQRSQLPTPQRYGLSPHIGTPRTPMSPARPKKTGSLALFYRKTYQLAYIRMKDLCERLGMDEDFVKKVWTCFEHCMMKSEDLMRDRHLDQLIMCSIYILAKALRVDGVTFQEIMRQYKYQPQAKSHVYRSVLLNSGPRVRPQPDTSSGPSQEDQPSSEAPSDRGSSKHTPVEQLLYRDDIPVGSRGDIIQFYNKIFIGFIKDFVLKFSPSEDTPKPTLSPLPMIRKTTSPKKKVSKHHQIFVSPHKSSQIQLSPLAKKYVIQKSPASDLQEINRALKRPLDLRASPQVQSPAKRMNLGGGPARKPHSLLQAMNSVANARAKSAANSSEVNQ